MKYLGWFAIVTVYLLTLLTQLPHVYHVYTTLESQDHRLLGIDTALGAAVAFEASVAIFTLRTIINTKSTRSRWTYWGLVGFLALSALSNVSYYFDVQVIDRWLMPAALTCAIPLALWLYAEEFGAEARAEVRKRRRVTAQSTAQPEPEPIITASDNGHERSFAEFERAVSAGDVLLPDMTGKAIAEWSGRSAATGRRWKRRLEQTGE